MDETAMAEAIPVELKQTDEGWQLYRGGEPYFIRGAGGTHSLEALAAAGANSVRTWDAEDVRGDDDVDVILDEAHALGLTVTVGIWLGHERHGFDYSDKAQVEQQMQRARGIVERYKDHPAVLLWGIGNEMEGFDDENNPEVWKAVNDIAAMVKELDPHHPTMTVTAFVHGDRIRFLHHESPAIDIHGVNAYGGAQTVPQRLRDGGASKPYVLTEYGPIGPWEQPTTEWGAPLEQTSEDKAAFYRETHDKAIASEPGNALGGYAFLWGNKMEGTATWFGMFLENGARTAIVDTMTEIWSGEKPKDRAPIASAIRIDGLAAVDPGAIVNVTTSVADPDGGDVQVRWVLRPDTDDFMTGGDFRPNQPEVNNVILDGRLDGARVRMPDEPGAYRLFLYAFDEAGNAATANLPLLVKGVPRARLPIPVYDDTFEHKLWAPSGWMGSVDSLTVNGEHTDDPYEGTASIKMRYEGTYGWVGVAWQNPPNNWGDMEGGYDLTGAGELEFWARGEYGGEKIGYGVGLLESDRAHRDSGIRKVDGEVLTREWRRYSIPVDKLDLSSIKTGFFVTLAGRQSPVTVYLDSIRFIR